MKFIFSFILLSYSFQSIAQKSVFDIEPNNKPETAQKFSGDAKIIGNLADGDQDLFLWDFSDADADYFWDIELKGVNGRLTRVDLMKLEFTEDGSGVTNVDKIYNIRHINGMNSVIDDNMIIMPGQYYIGISYANDPSYKPPNNPLGNALSDLNEEEKNLVQQGQEPNPQTGYSLTFHKKRKISNIRFKKDPNKAVNLNKEKPFGFLMTNKTHAFQFKINEEEAQKLWQINGRASIANSISLTLHKEDDSQIADASSNSKGYYSFEALNLEAGNYIIKTSTNSINTVASISVQSRGVQTEGAEKEPNNYIKTANLIDWNSPIAGIRNKSNDTDLFKFVVSEKQSNRYTKIQLNNLDQTSIELCLRTPDNNNLKCIENKEEILSLNKLVLAPGDYYAYIYRGAIDTKYELTILDQGIRKPIQEAEPNDKFSLATATNNKRIIKGDFDGYEFDCFKFNSTEKPQLWTIQAIGTNISEIYLYNSGGSYTQSLSYPGSNKRAKLSNLFLMPGEHTTCLRGKNGKYLLRAFPTGDPDPSFEFEPNDDVSRSMLLAFDKPRKGTLSEGRDKDIYRFHLANEEHIQLKIKPPSDGNLRYIMKWFNSNLADKTSKEGNELVFKGLIKAGDYTINLTPAGSQKSDDTYTIELNRLSRFSCNGDCEPNDSIYAASKINTNDFIQGESNTHGDNDWYQLPVHETETKFSFKKIAAGYYQTLRIYHLVNNKKVEIKGTKDDANQTIHFVIPAGVTAYAMVTGTGEYNFSISINDEPSSKELNSNKLFTIQMNPLPSKVAAYHPYAQRVSGEFKVKNISTEKQNGLILSDTSNHDWQILNLPESISLEPNQELSFPFEIIVAKNSIGLRTSRISIGIKDKNKLVSEAWREIDISGNANPFNSELNFTVPEKLQGGLNIASEMFGNPLSEQELTRLKAYGRGYKTLFNGYGFQGYGMLYRNSKAEEEHYIDIKLAGKGESEIIGIILNPLADYGTSNFLKDFEFQISNDKTNYQTVLKSELKQIGTEQSFTFDKSYKAKFARLKLLSNHSGLNNHIGLGEWKVITQPKNNINNGEGFNIADPKLGGFVPWSFPNAYRDWDKGILEFDVKSRNLRSTKNQPWQWVVGFHNQRAAKISNIEWIKPELSDPLQTFNKVKISVSTQSPTGPWKFLGNFDLPQNNNKITLDNPTWARYVKFDVGLVKPREYKYIAQQIKIFETPVSDSYSSILGEWGEMSKQSLYEKEQNNLLKIESLSDANNNSKSSAKQLIASQIVNGEVQLEFADKPDWYKYTIPANQNTLNVTLMGEPTVSTILSIQNETGEEIPSTKIESEINKVVFQATIEAGKTYYLKVEEPKRSTIFSWDTSGSTSGYHAIIFQALSQFTDGVIPKRDLVNFLPFGSDLLLDEWYGEPYFLKSVLNDYDRKDGSSDSEQALIIASKALSKRQGSISIVVITDALTGRTKGLWDQLNEVKPRIFSIGLIQGSSGNSHETQFDLLQSWASVNNGEFDKVSSTVDLEIAFDKAASKLRQPARYGIAVESEFIEAPGPGKLVIKQNTADQSAAVELILDASGSMLKRLNGKRRINIAKEVLVKTITDIIPAKTPVAIRVFGDQQANACRTDLRMPLQPLNAANANSIIQKVNAKNLAKTPIADSIAKVATDLKSHKGKKIVILLTDGEETCDGKPDEVINKLIEGGIDIRLNIVGFAINQQKLKDEFTSWAQQGSGKYFDSNDPESLKSSISEALQTPYSVFNLAGELIAEGTVNGEPLELPAGFYDIKVHSSKVISYDKYQIKGEIDQAININ